MFNALQNPLALLGRLLMAYLFLPAGLAKISGFDYMTQYVASAGLPAPALGVVIAIVVEVIGGAALVLGLGTRLAALVLAVFTVVAAVAFHPYWSVPAESQMIVSLLFNKNIAIAGGLLVLAAFGGGAWSLEAKRTAK
ncbi:DoxX family protein [Orrella sp. NBD-18]|uniref:DoxX family protein n=1 Tax=Sheuella amnicola TaxID=2707330 RepID=A0A6B2QX95_9BURK|nr:DoxX family protein [Sheuella amnicola]NDY82613.1 DoxX family protein [Sheuella amnicola]HBI82121.1 DoxX family protein [Alcaligenaceae bacterium]